jgi:hypothetical protein
MVFWNEQFPAATGRRDEGCRVDELPVAAIVLGIKQYNDDR